MGEVILITSGKGGVGKTTLAANLGAGLAAKEKKTLIVDMNQGLRQADLVLGLENKIVYNIFDAFKKNRRLSQVITKDTNRPGLSLLASSQIKKQQDLNPAALEEMISELKQHYDYCIIDGCSGIDMGFENSTVYYDRAVIVCTGDVLSVRAADRIKEQLMKLNHNNISILINRVRPELIASGDMMNKDEIEEILGVPVLGIVTEDTNLYVSSNKGKTITGEESAAGQSLMRITRRILGEDIPIPEMKTNNLKKSGFWSFFMRG